MSANIFGNRFKVVSFGESHGPAYGVVIEGMPSGVEFNHDLLIKYLNERRPGQGLHVTERNEMDLPEILSGIYENKTLGTPIAVIVKNKDQRAQDYQQIKSDPRIGHADDVWKNKFEHTDHRGGGRSSGRETLNRVIAGAFAEMLFNTSKIKTEVLAMAEQIGPYKINSNEISSEVKKFLEEAKQKGESYGGIISCEIKNPPQNLGQPVFHKLKSDLASAMLGIGAVEGFEFGAGFKSAEMVGTDFHQQADSVNYGGIRGGISTGESIHFKIVFKPTSSIKDVAKIGRHDPCIVPRAVPVVRAMAWMVLADHLLWTKTDRV